MGEKGKVNLVKKGDVIKYDHATILTPNHTQILAMICLSR